MAPGTVTPLRQARLHASLSLSQFAQAVHVSTACASRWETGRRRPHSDDVRRIATVLGVDIGTAITWFADTSLLATERLPHHGLARLRAAAGLTRRSLARLLDVSPATVAHWECGRRALPQRRMSALAGALGLDVAELTERLARRPISVPPPPLAQLRIDAGLTQKSAARRLSVSSGTVSAWEREIRRPTWAQARQLADVFGCPIGEVARATGLRVPSTLSRERLSRAGLPAALTDIRRWRGETLRQVADRAHVNWQTVRRWETGVTRPTADRLRALEHALGLQPGLLPRS